MFTEEYLWVWALALVAVLTLGALVLFPPERWLPGETALVACEVAHPDWAERTVRVSQVLERSDKLTVQRLGTQEATFTVCEGITRRWLWAGMTESMARASWGPPHRIVRMPADVAVELEWIYDPVFLQRNGARLRFVDGELAEWQMLPK